MNQKFDMTVTLSPEQVKEAIAEYVKRELDTIFVAPNEVELNVAMVDGTIDGGGITFPTFKNAQIKVKKAGSYQDR